MQVLGLNGCFARLSNYSSVEVGELSEKARFKYQVLDNQRLYSYIIIIIGVSPPTRKT